MPLNCEEIISVVKQVSEQNGMQATIKGVGKGTCIVGACAATGGILGGPVGLSIGGILGSVMALIQGKGQYKSVPEIIYEMSPTQKKQLAKSVEDIFKDFDTSDVTMIVAMFMANNSLQSMLLSQVSQFFKSEMGLQLMNS